MAPPGHYAMKVAQEVIFLHCPDTRVLVSSFVVFRYDVLCESGMRSLDLGSSDPASSGATSKAAYAFGPWWPGDCRFWEVCDGVSPFAVAGEGPCEGGGIESYKYWCRSAA